MQIQDEIERLYSEWLVAAATHDIDWFRANIAEEFFYITAAGQTIDRDELYAAVNRSQNSEYHLRHVTAVEYGDVILAKGQYFGRGDLPKGEVSEALYRIYTTGSEMLFSGTWTRRQGTLRALHFQTTVVPE